MSGERVYNYRLISGDGACNMGEDLSLGRELICRERVDTWERSYIWEENLYLMRWHTSSRLISEKSLKCMRILIEVACVWEEEYV